MSHHGLSNGSWADILPSILRGGKQSFGKEQFSVFCSACAIISIHSEPMSKAEASVQMSLWSAMCQMQSAYCLASSTSWVESRMVRL